MLLILQDCEISPKLYTNETQKGKIIAQIHSGIVTGIEAAYTLARTYQAGGNTKKMIELSHLLHQSIM